MEILSASGRPQLRTAIFRETVNGCRFSRWPESLSALSTLSIIVFSDCPSNIILLPVLEQLGGAHLLHTRALAMHGL